MATIFVGDVHGCRAELDALLQAVEFRPQNDRLLLTGDAFSRGPDPLGVWQLIERCSAEMVLGNHDARLLEHLRHWCAGRQPACEQADHRRVLTALAPVADSLLPWLEERPLCIEADRFVLVHAGINPEHGIRGTSRDEFLAIRLWPPARGTTGKRWHEAYTPEARPLIFGHDAPGGLVVRRDARNRPYLIGLDSGCVYGNQLSAYVLEEDRIVQETCHQPGGYWSTGSAVGHAASQGP